MDKIATCLWFDRQAEEAANFYVSLIPDSAVTSVERAPADYPNGKAGDALMVTFTLAGRTFTGLNGGPNFKFTEAISLQIDIADQAELDFYYDKLSVEPASEQCGWIKDKYGLSWQLVPRRLIELMTDADTAKGKRAMEAMMHMKRLDIAALERAAAGE